MAAFALGFLIIAGSVAGLALGVVLGRPPLRGSCGGITCGACGRCPRHTAAADGAAP